MLDVRMPEMGGLEVQQRLSEAGIGLPIIFITAHGDVPTCAQALKAGAIDFLEKPVDGQDLSRSHPQSPGSRRNRTMAEIAARMSRLSPCEREVLDMLVSGRSLKEIATVNNVRTETIWKHRNSVFSKMKVETTWNSFVS